MVMIRWERWLKLLVGGIVLLLFQWVFPDLIAALIENSLQRPDISLYTGLRVFLWALLVVWKVSGGGLFVAGIVDLFRSRRRS